MDIYEPQDIAKILRGFMWVFAALGMLLIFSVFAEGIRLAHVPFVCFANAYNLSLSRQEVLYKLMTAEERAAAFRRSRKKILACNAFFTVVGSALVPLVFARGRIFEYLMALILLMVICMIWRSYVKLRRVSSNASLYKNPQSQ